MPTTYEDLINDPDVAWHYPLDITDPVATSYPEASGRRQNANNAVATTAYPLDDSSNVSIEGTDPFTHWRPYYWSNKKARFAKVQTIVVESWPYGDELTVALWVKIFGSYTGTYDIIIKDGSTNSTVGPFAIRTFSTWNNIEFLYQDFETADYVRQFNTTNSPFNDRSWHHVATTYNANTWETDFYIDGEPAVGVYSVNSPVIGNIRDVSGFLTCGCYPNSQAEFNPVPSLALSDVIAFDRALSQAEIQTLMAGPSAGGNPLAPGLVNSLTFPLGFNL